MASMQKFHALMAYLSIILASSFILVNSFAHLRTRVIIINTMGPHPQLIYLHSLST